MTPIDLHQRAIEILEATRHFERRKQTLIENLDGFCGTFPELNRKYRHQVEIMDRCIARMKQRYIGCIVAITIESFEPRPPIETLSPQTEVEKRKQNNADLPIYGAKP